MVAMPVFSDDTSLGHRSESGSKRGSEIDLYKVEGLYDE
jgi:hypothetical protein